MNQKPAICIGCGSVRFLQYGNPRAHTCGDSRIVWVQTTVRATRLKILADFKEAGQALNWKE